MKTKITDSSGDRRNFTIIPNYILDHSSLWDREVYIQMKRIAGEEGTCWYSQAKLAKKCGIGVSRLRKSLDVLIKNKWIEYVGEKKIPLPNGEQATKEYRVVDIWEKNSEFFSKKTGNKGACDTSKGRGVLTRQVGGGAYETKGGVLASQAGGVLARQALIRTRNKKNPIKDLIPLAKAKDGSLIKNTSEVLTNNKNKRTVKENREINLAIEILSPINPDWKSWHKPGAMRTSVSKLVKFCNEDKKELKELVKKIMDNRGKEFQVQIHDPCDFVRKYSKLITERKKDNKNIKSYDKGDLSRYENRKSKIIIKN